MSTITPSDVEAFTAICEIVKRELQLRQTAANEQLAQRLATRIVEAVVQPVNARFDLLVQSQRELSRRRQLPTDFK